MNLLIKSLDQLLTMRVTKMYFQMQKQLISYKHNKALHQEIYAAKSLIDKSSSSKVTLHYDTTSRSRIDGEWPAIIINIMDDNPSLCKMINLRPLFFAFEDRVQITRLIIETLKEGFLQLPLDSIPLKCYGSKLTHSCLIQLVKT